MSAVVRSSAFDQLEIIAPDGQVKFHDLSSPQGITNVGRHPENNVILDGPEVAFFHAIIDHQQKPYRFIDLLQDGQGSQSTLAREINYWDAIRIGGYTLILLEGIGAAASASPMAIPIPAEAAPKTGALPPASPLPQAPVALGPVVRLTKPPPEHHDDVIVVELAAREWVVDVEQTATCQMTVVNGGDIVANFDVRVEGLDPEWVTISPPEVYLFEGQRATVMLSFTPPRDPASQAGMHHCSLIATSPEHPTRSSRLSAALTINPYYEFTVGDISPRQQTVYWSRRVGQAVFPIANKGNGEATFRVDGQDDERGCTFEFQLPNDGVGLARQIEVRLPPGQILPVTVNITPIRRSLLALRRHLYSYTFTTTPLAGQQAPRTVLGQLDSAPLIGPGLLALLLLLFAGLIVLIFRPSIGYFGTDPALADLNAQAVRIQAGENLTLYWKASLFSSLRLESSIDQDPEAGSVPGPLGSKEIGPLEDVTYALVAENFLTRLSAQWFGARREVKVAVGAVLPTVTLSADPQVIVRGESATLSWQVANAEKVVLIINGVLETIPPEQYANGSRLVTPDQDTVYEMRAFNRYTDATGQAAVLTVKVLEPTSTPPPPPVILRFDIQPTVITAGQSIKIEWAVNGVDKVTLNTDSGSLGDFTATGSTELVPEKTTTYKLTATNGLQTETRTQLVTVNPAPTATPVPKAPEIQVFAANPLEVIQGSAEANAVQLAWRVSGEVTNVELASTNPSFGKVSNLKSEGTITVSVGSTTLFILTAFNGTLSASQTVQVVVKPPPTPTSSPTPSPTPVPTPTVVALTIEDANNPSSNEKVKTQLVYDPAQLAYTARVVIGTLVRFRWNMGNTTKVTFNGVPDKAPIDSETVAITSTARTVFELDAFSPPNPSANIFIKLTLEARPPLPPPIGVDGSLNSPTPGVVLTWTYTTTLNSEIIGFRIYRANPAGGAFSPLPDVLLPTARTTTDPTGNCGMEYYVVALYVDVDNPLKESVPSLNSWDSPPCPMVLASTLILIQPPDPLWAWRRSE